MDLMGHGAACSPDDLRFGRQWCYTSGSCPYAESTMQGQYMTNCPPAFNSPPPPPPSVGPAPPPKCEVPIRQHADWVPISSASTQQRVSYGTGRVEIGRTTQSSGESSNIGFSIGVGMSFGVVHVGIDVAFGVDDAFQKTSQASGTVHRRGDTASRPRRGRRDERFIVVLTACLYAANCAQVAFEQSTGQTFSTSYGPGVVWQWQWFVETACANHTAYAQVETLTRH